MSHISPLAFSDVFSKEALGNAAQTKWAITAGCACTAPHTLRFRFMTSQLESTLQFSIKLIESSVKIHRLVCTFLSGGRLPSWKHMAHFASKAEKGTKQGLFPYPAQYAKCLSPSSWLPWQGVGAAKVRSFFYKACWSVNTRTPKASLRRKKGERRRNQFLKAPISLQVSVWFFTCQCQSWRQCRGRGTKEITV